MSDYTFTATDPDIQQRSLDLFAEYQKHPFNLKTIKYLVKAGVDVHTRDERNKTPLHNAAFKDHMEICALLIAEGADVHVQDDGYCRPLDLAAEYNKPKAVKTLLAHGANIWAEDLNGAMSLNVDNTGLLRPHKETWEVVLDEVRSGDYTQIRNVKDLYYLASVMKPADPKDIPHPKEFIRILFQQYLLHEPEFNAMYSEIFGQSRPPVQDLKAAREAAKGRGVVL